VTTVLPAALVAARLEGVPTIVYAAEIYDQPWKGRATWSTLHIRLTTRLASAIVCCSQAVAHQFPRGPTTIAVAYPPIEPDYANGDRELARRRHLLEDAEPCLAVVGNISPGRGHDVAVRALSLVKERFPSAALLIDGEPEPASSDIAFAADVRRLARELEVDDAVRFAGFSPDVRDTYAAADIVVNPARFEEPFGRVALEALVAGRPVVSTRVGGVPEAIRDGHDGLLVPPEDPHALASVVIGLWENPDLRRQLVESGRRRVIERFDAEQSRRTWTEVVDAVLAA
jgi:glycosyltransferase involved in cell wall biosynthesis